MKQRVWQRVHLEKLATVASEVHQYLQGAPSVWCFKGEMGTGKTTFIKHLCHVFGVVDTVQSPTYGLVNEYETAGGETVYHFDFYRLESAREAFEIGTVEYLESGARCLLEWPERIEPLLPQEHVQLQITLQPDNSRTIEVSIHGTTH